MRQIVLLSAFLLSCGSIFCQQGKDTEKKDTPVTSTPPGQTTDAKPVTPNSTQGTANTVDTVDTVDTVKKSNADSISLTRDLEFQQNHPEWIYQAVIKKNAKGELIKNAKGGWVKTRDIWPALAIGFLLVAGLGFWLLSNTALCRDQSYYPQTNQLRPVKERPFSYSKLQLFWWTIIILTCFTVSYFYTWRLIAFTPTMVLLLGGGLATSMFGKVIDNTQIQQNNNGVPTRHQDLQKSQGLFVDILSDETGISIHRFQSVIINIVFGLSFVISFFEAVRIFQFPFIDFQNWQLTLLGISSGAYLGFKTNENSDATKQKRQIEAIKNTTTLNTTVETSASPPQQTTQAYEKLRSELQLQGLVTDETERAVIRDMANFNQ